jgi:hypothetical protein
LAYKYDMAIDLDLAVIARWDNPDPSHITLLRLAGIEAIVLSAADPRFSQSCDAAGIRTLLADDLQWLALKDCGAARSAKPVVLTEGSWPGVAHPAAVAGRGDETASASREPWIEIDSFWVPYLRALFPDRPAVLGPKADPGERMIPFDSLELALIEARVLGGNFILHIEPRYRAALLRGDEKALAAWRQLGRTARWLREQKSLMGLPVFPQVTQLVELGAETAEVAKLMYRRNVSPAVAAADRPPVPDREHRLALVAVELRKPADGVRNRILAHADAGAFVVVNGDWWRTSRLRLLRKEEDRDFYGLGRGQIVAYRDAIADPSEFALDVVDLITHKRRAARLWNAPAVVAVASGKGILHCVNYGSPAGMPVQARIQGVYSKATLLRPDAETVALKVARRGSTTEVMIPEIRHLATIVFA